MNTAAKFGLAAAVVVVAALLGFNYLVAPNVGGPGLDDPLRCRRQPRLRPSGSETCPWTLAPSSRRDSGRASR